MANPHTPRAIPYQHNQKTPSSSTAIFPLLYTTMCLHNWWLIKTKKDSEGRQLGVGGFAYREGRGERVFHSEAIAKRHDANTLETVDGVTITVIGFIDLPHTRQNGFPSKVCDRFLIGFPYDWEEYATRYCGEKSSEEAVSSGISGLDGSHMPSSDGTNSTLPTSFDDLPVNRVRDLLMSATNDSEYSALSTIIFNDILRKCGGDSVPDKTPRHHDKTMVDQKHKDNNCVYSTLMRAQETRKNQSQSEKGADVYSTSMRAQETRKSQSQSEKGADVYSTSMRAQETCQNQSQSEKGVDVYSTSMRAQETRKSQSQSEKGVDVYSTSMRAQETRKNQSQSENGVDVYSTSMRTQETHKSQSQSQSQSEKRVDVYKLSKGVATRSMTRSKNLTNNKEENLSNRSVLSSELEDSNVSLFDKNMQVKENLDKSAETICDMPKTWSKTRKNASNISHTNMLSGEAVESSIRRSKRQKNMKK